MAFEMSFTDEYGVVFSNSYWRVAQIHTYQSYKSGNIIFHGFQDEANKGKRIIGQKSYDIDSAAYEANFDVDSLNPDGVNPVLAAYLHAAATLDTGEDENKVSFFDGAIVV